MNLKRCISALIIVLLMLTAPAAQADEENLILNPDFSKLDETGLPEFWYTDAYEQEAGFTYYRSSADDPEHPHAVMIQNISANDARFAQTVPVDAESYYILSGYIRTEDVEGGHGANLSFGDVYVFNNQQYKPLYDTNGQWKYVEYYGVTGPDQVAADIYARLGGYGGESTGKAWFSDISLRKTEKLPAGIEPVPMYRETTVYDEYSDEDEDEEEENGEGTFRLPLFLIVMLYTAAAFMILKMAKSRNIVILDEQNSGKAAAAVILLAAFLTRILISSIVEGYMVDVNCFLSWGYTMASAGPARFYQATNFCDYPPLYTYILALNSILTDSLGGGETTARIVYRFVPCLCDIAGCCTG